MTVHESTTTNQPNILYMMSDDHASNSIGCYATLLRGLTPTPNIDRIAAEGMRLDNCFCTNSICVPSRATILTGQYSHVNKVYTLKNHIDPARQNVAKLLRGAGYQTAIVGKWHLGTEPQGFDYYNVLPGQGKYVNPAFKEKGKPWQDRDDGGEVYEGYATDIITDISLKWLESRDKSKPFFLMYHHKAPHGPWKYHERHEDMYKDVKIPEPESIREDKSHRSSGSRDYATSLMFLADRFSTKNWDTGTLDTTGMDDDKKLSAVYQKYLKDYLRTTAAIDENVGRMLDYLDENGLTENTIVIYTSDQGLFLGEHQYFDKRWMFEESLRMPFVVRYPGKIAKRSANNDIILNTDFAPLFLNYAGADASSEMQGRSFRPCLEGNAPDDWRESMYYRYWMHERRPAHYGIRTKRYKLIFFYGLPLDAVGTFPEAKLPGVELYDLEKDPNELKNVYGDPDYEKVAGELIDELLRLKDEVGDTDEQYPELEALRKKMLGK